MQKPRKDHKTQQASKLTEANEFTELSESESIKIVGGSDLDPHVGYRPPSPNPRPRPNFQ